jgi:N-dimethylarginine dimethylaminohydrolase
MKKEIVLNINEFLSSYSQNRNLDDAFKNWFRKKDPRNPKKTVEEWKQLFSEFYA